MTKQSNDTSLKPFLLIINWIGFCCFFFCIISKFDYWSTSIHMLNCEWNISPAEKSCVQEIWNSTVNSGESINQTNPDCPHYKNSIAVNETPTINLKNRVNLLDRESEASKYNSPDQQQKQWNLQHGNPTEIEYYSYCMWREREDLSAPRPALFFRVLR